MRRIRSESWTFIWQPKVRMQAVLVSPGGEGGLPASQGPPGFLEIRTGVGVVWAASLMVFLRFVDAGLHGNLSGTALEPELPGLEVTRPRRPPKYIRDGAPFLLAQREHRSVLRRPPLPPLPRLFTAARGQHRADRFHLPAPDPLHRPQRNVQAEAPRPLPQRGCRIACMYY